MVPIQEYLSLRERPGGSPVMFQSWRDLLFLHFSTQPEIIQGLLPDGLTVDTFPSGGEERAWVGLVPFRMLGIRSPRLPSAPWLSASPETNVRTYVHREGHGPGVWFFSLDAARWLACQVARQSFGLPYYHALMSCRRNGDEIRYRSRRFDRGTSRPHLDICARLGSPLPLAEPGSL
ncbi:MAG TPA: DUF2071 domain-containing protein, partial [Fimbriimonadaceae bacterium]|nr:DUF2071 domain-containing protein [Fimbriimonadaceae bacterium]